MLKSQYKIAKKNTDDFPAKVPDDIRSALLFSNLPDEELACFRSAAQNRHYKKDKIIYRHEDAAENFYIICSGWVKLFNIMPEGDEVIVDILTSGHMFGESAIFAKNYHMCTAQVIAEAQILSIPSKLLHKQIQENSTLALNMLHSLSEHHRRHYSELAFNAMLNAPQRIGYFLLRLCPQRKNKNIMFDLPYDKSIIADTLGMKGATFSRGLNALRTATGIRIKDRHIEICSVERLATFVYGTRAIKYIS